MIDAKQSFLSQVRKRAAEELTAADMERLMVILPEDLVALVEDALEE